MSLGAICAQHTDVISIGYNWSYPACEIAHLVPIWHAGGPEIAGLACACEWLPASLADVSSDVGALLQAATLTP
jgi:hypothetical protein